jgi:hypothetical protein
LQENAMTGADLNIPHTTDPIDQRAYDLATRVNEAIQAACAGTSGLRWRTIAEQEAERLVDSELWEFAWVEPIGHPPRIAITQYKGT